MEPDKTKYEEWRKDPNNWKLGFLYFNKEDKRIFPLKRWGLGWTVNLANPLSVAVLILMLAAILIAGEIIKRFIVS